MDICTIGTRGSGLALWQANAVADALRAANPGLEVELRVVKTEGDRILDKPLAKLGDKGLFTKELERDLLDGAVDLCVHSMKDVPTELPCGCTIAGMLPRADARDALVCGPRIAGVRALSDLPAGARIGTGSLRRAAQLRALFPQVVLSEIRGNIDTRLAKAAGDDYEGAILAVAGLARMGWDDRIAAYLSVDEMVPAVGQGAVGIEARSDDKRVLALVASISHAETTACVNAERRVLAALEGGCQVPVGAYARWAGSVEARTLVFDALVAATDGSRVARVHMERACDFDARHAVELSDAVFAALLEQGAREILDGIRTEGGEA